MVLEKLEKLNRIARPVQEKPIDDAVSVWVEPVLVAEIGYSSLTQARYLRAPVFIRLRPDVSPEDCVMDEE
jgi:ATP-dependent DNA ligase